MNTQDGDVKFPQSLSQLAQKIADEALDKDVSLSDRIEAFKVLATYHIGVTRVTKKTSTETEEVATFGALKEKMLGAK